jgi:hypothetical protein
MIRPSMQEIDSALDRIVAILKLVEDGDMPIATALQEIHEITDLFTPKVN